jgi:hypothetical protein
MANSPGTINSCSCWDWLVEVEQKLESSSIWWWWNRWDWMISTAEMVLTDDPKEEEEPSWLLLNLSSWRRSGAACSKGLIVIIISWLSHLCTILSVICFSTLHTIYCTYWLFYLFFFLSRDFLITVQITQPQPWILINVSPALSSSLGFRLIPRPQPTHTLHFFKSPQRTEPLLLTTQKGMLEWMKN